jgi:hypothetical protein
MLFPPCKTCGAEIEAHEKNGFRYWRHVPGPNGEQPKHPASPALPAAPPPAEPDEPDDEQDLSPPVYSAEYVDALKKELADRELEIERLRASHEAYVLTVKQVFEARFSALGSLQQILANQALTDKMARDLALTSLSSLTPLSPLAPEKD